MLRGDCATAVTLLQHRDACERRAALELLEQLAPNTTLPISPVIRALADADAPVRWAAVSTLSKVSSSAVTQHTSKLIKLLHHKDSGVRVGALDVLAQLGELVVAHADTVAMLLTDSDGTVQWAAVEALRSMGQPAAAAIAPLLCHSSASVRMAAAEAVSNHSKEAATHRNAEMDIDAMLKDPSTQLAALDAAQAQGESAALHVTAIAAVLTATTDAAIRIAALSALEQLPTAAVEPHMCAILSLLNSEDSLAVQAVAKAHCRALVPLLSVPDRQVQRVAMEALAGAKEAAAPYVSAIVRHFKAPDLLMRHKAVQAIGQLGGVVAAPYCHPIRMMMREQDDSIRMAALEAMGSLGAAAHTGSVASLLSDPVWGIRRKALFVLDELEAVHSHTNGVLASLQDVDPKVRKAAVQVLASLGPAVGPYLGALADRLEDSDVTVRSAAVEALEALHWWKQREFV